MHASAQTRSACGFAYSIFGHRVYTRAVLILGHCCETYTGSRIGHLAMILLNSAALITLSWCSNFSPCRRHVVRLRKQTTRQQISYMANGAASRVDSLSSLFSEDAYITTADLTLIKRQHCPATRVMFRQLQWLHEASLVIADLMLDTGGNLPGWRQVHMMKITTVFAMHRCILYAPCTLWMSQHTSKVT